MRDASLPISGAFVAGAACLLVLAISGTTLGSDEFERSPEQWVEQLGAPRYAQRERASKVLVELGMNAWDALRQASNSSDPEIRYRARRALSVIEADELERQLQRFEQDTSGTGQFDLPGWDLYRAVVGDSVESRQLFVKMARAEPALLRALPGDRRQLSELLVNRCWEMQVEMQRAATMGQRTLQNPSAGTVAMLLFVGGLSEVLIDDLQATAISNYVGYLVRQRNRPKESGAEPPERRLLAHWISRDWSNMPMGAYQAMMLSMSHDLPEGLNVASKQLAIPGGPPHVRQFAALTVGRFGTGEHIPALLPLLEDETICWNRQGNELATEVRDVALAVLIQMTGQSPKQYGLPSLQSNRTLYLNASSVQFRSKADRAAALARWKLWYNDNRDSLPASN